MLLNNQWVKEEKKNTLRQLKMEMQHIKMYGMQQKHLLREEFWVINAYLKKQKKSQVNNITLHLKDLEK